MLLGLASGNTFLDASDQSLPGTLHNVSSDVANIAKQAFYDFGERPIWTERVTYGTSESIFLVSCSSKSEKVTHLEVPYSAVVEKVSQSILRVWSDHSGKRKSPDLGILSDCIHM